MDVLKTLSRLRAANPREILKTLVGREPRILLSLFTLGGHRFSGWPIDVRQDGAGEYVLMQATEDLHSNSPDVVCLPLDGVLAVRIHDALQAAPILSFGDVARAPGEPAPTRLELKRRVRAISEALRVEVDVDWAAVPDEDDAYLNLRDLGATLEKVVPELRRDEAGRSAWSSVARIQIRHQTSAFFSASKRENDVAVVLDLTRKLPDPLDRRLSDQLNSIF